MATNEPEPQPSRQRSVKYALCVVVPAVFLVVFVLLGLSWPAALGIQILVCAAVFAWWLTDSQSPDGHSIIDVPPNSADQS